MRFKRSKPLRPGWPRATLTTYQTAVWSVVQRTDADFLEMHVRVIAMILQTKVARHRSRSSVWLIPYFLFGNSVAFGMIRDDLAVNFDHRVFSVERD